MKGTNVFASKKEMQELKDILNTPVMMIFEPRRDARKVCHEMALKHGLPEIPGFYGIKGTGEFVTD